MNFKSALNQLTAGFAMATLAVSMLATSALAADRVVLIEEFTDSD